MNTFETIILISMASLGFRCITDKGMIFYFLRQPFDKISDRKKHVSLQIENMVKFREVLRSKYPKELDIDEMQKEVGKIQRRVDYFLKEERSKMRVFNDWLIYCMKPIILCTTCMSSVHTLIWWPILVGEYTLFTIVTMLSVAFLNTLLYLIIEKLQGK